MTGEGLVNAALSKSYKMASAEIYAGILVIKTANANEVNECDASHWPIGYTIVNTVPASQALFADGDENYTPVGVAGKYIGVVGIVPGNKAALKLLTANAAIAIGDEIVCAAGGMVDKKSGAGMVLGVANEARDGSSGGTAGTTHIEIIFAPRYAAA